jgi:hypothetical protein
VQLLAGLPAQQQQQLAAAGSSGGVGSPHRARAAAALNVEETSPDAAAGSSSGGFGSSSMAGWELLQGSSGSSGFVAMYPSGRLFVRCGWVSDAGVEPHFTPFQHTDRPFALGHAKETALQHTLRLPNSSSFGDDGLVQVNVTSRPAASGAFSMRTGSAPSSPSKPQTGDYLGTTNYSNPLAFHGAASLAAGLTGSSKSSPRKDGGLKSTGGSSGADAMFGNPLAHLGQDVEVGQMLAPPMPPLKADRALQRVVQGVGYKVRLTAPMYTSTAGSKQPCTGLYDGVTTVTLGTLHPLTSTLSMS